MKPKVCVLADVRSWAWDRKAQEYVRWLSDEFEITLRYQKDGAPDASAFDLMHCFEVSQTGHVPAFYRERGGKVVAGLTAHVNTTWGDARMHEWATRCDALHGNSLLLVDVLKPFHQRVYYTPNGVDAYFWQRTCERSPGFVVSHVGKPNPRKGAHMIIDACSTLDIPLLLCQRTSHIALAPDKLRDEFYSPTWVQITLSDMDGTPNPMLEAASVGNMLISTRIGNMPEFIRNGVNGFLIERSTEALEETLQWCLDHNAYVIAMGREARRTVLADWTWEKQVDHVRTMWRQVLA